MTLCRTSRTIFKEIPGVFRRFIPSGMHPSLNALCCGIKIVPEIVYLLPSGCHLSIRRIQIIPSALRLYPAGICLMVRSVKLPSAIFIRPASHHRCCCISWKSGLYRKCRRKHNKCCLLLQCLFHIVLLRMFTVRNLLKQVPLLSKKMCLGTFLRSIFCIMKSHFR